MISGVLLEGLAHPIFPRDDNIKSTYTIDILIMHVVYMYYRYTLDVLYISYSWQHCDGCVTTVISRHAWDNTTWCTAESGRSHGFWAKIPMVTDEAAQVWFWQLRIDSNKTWWPWACLKRVSVFDCRGFTRSSTAIWWWAEIGWRRKLLCSHRRSVAIAAACSATVTCCKYRSMLAGLVSVCWVTRRLVINVI